MRWSVTSPGSGSTCATCAASLPDLEAFPNFDDNLRQAFKRETELFFGSIMHEDHNVLDLLNADLHLRQRAPGHGTTEFPTCTAASSAACP